MALRRKKHSQRVNRKRPIEHTGFYAYLQRYLEGLKLKGYAEQTHIRHDGEVRRLAAWCAERGINTPQEVTKPILECYRKYLYYYRKSNGKPLSFSSQKSMLVVVKGFFRWLSKENYLLYNPASELQTPKPPRRLPRTILSLEQIETIFNQPDISTVNGLRDRSIMELMYACGLRRNEVSRLQVFDVDLKRLIVSVNAGKGGKDRLLPLSERAAAWLQKYIDEAYEQLRSPMDEERLFIADYGEPMTGGRLYSVVKRYMKAAGVIVEGACHLFRHAMATHMLDNGADIRFIQAMLGHEDLTSTQIYTRVSMEKLRQIQAATHPAANKRRSKRDDAPGDVEAGDDAPGP